MQLAALTDDPTVIESDGGVEIDRWTKYGKDRLYIDTGTNHSIPRKAECYIDLKASELVCETDDVYGSSPDVRMNVDEDGVATLTKHWSHQGTDHEKTVLVIDLFGKGAEVPAEA